MTQKNKIILLLVVVILGVAVVSVYHYFATSEEPAQSATASSHSAVAVAPKSSAIAPVQGATDTKVVVPPAQVSPGSTTMSVAANTITSSNASAAQPVQIAKSSSPVPASPATSDLPKPAAAQSTFLADRVDNLIRGMAILSIDQRAEIRRNAPGVEVIPLKDDRATDEIHSSTGYIYNVPAEKHFFIIWTKMISSSVNMYGPFDGDPRTVLDLPPATPPASTSNSAPSVGTGP